MILLVVFIVLMLLWLFGGGAYAFRSQPADRPYAFGGYLLPWICVAILGYCVFSGVDIGPPARPVPVQVQPVR